MNILITGASGFIGSFLCEECLRRQYTVWAGMRTTSSRKWLQNEWLHFVTLDMTDTDILRQQLSSFKDKHGKWDIIVHAGGATKCLNVEDFDKNNFLCTRNLVETLFCLDMLPSQFLYVSSLSVLGAIREQMVDTHSVTIPKGSAIDDEFISRYTIQQSVYEPMLDTDTPYPNTAYGASKLKSEEYLRNRQVELFSQGIDFNFTIFRPTGVYGPREKDYYLMVKSINSHYDFAVGYKPQEITFVYVQDLVDAILSAIGNANAKGKSYAVSDGFVYSSRAFSDLIQKELNRHAVLHIKAPLFLLKAICRLGEWFSHLTGKLITLNKDKYNILAQRNWQCDISPIQHDLGFTPQWNLERGVKETISWYKENKWI